MKSADWIKESRRGAEFDVLQKTILTEKSVMLESNNNTLCFYCRLNITKTHIKAAIEKIFPGAIVLRVNIIRQKGTNNIFRQHEYKTSNRKKAMVKLLDMSYVKGEK